MSVVKSTWWRAPRWPDGRLISPLDVGVPLWVLGIVVLLVAGAMWLLGQTGLPTSLTVPRAGLVLAVLAVASAACLVASNVRRWRLSQELWRSTVADDRAASAWAAPSLRWWRPARWPDGLYVADGLIANTLAVLGVCSILAAAWVFGGAGVIETGVGNRWGSLAPVLVLPASLTAFVTSRRAMTLAERSAAS